MEGRHLFTATKDLLKSNVSDFERRIIAYTLQRTGGNQARQDNWGRRGESS